MLTVFGNWGAEVTITCEEGFFEGGFFGGSADYILCDGTVSTVNLGPDEISKILCIQSGSITNSTLIWNSTGPCEVGFSLPHGDNAFTVERGSDGFSTYVQYNSNYAVNDIVVVSSYSGCFEIMGTANVNDPGLFGVITEMCLY